MMAKLDDLGEFTDLATWFCLEKSPDGYICTEEPDHEGWHRAVLDGKLLDNWPEIDDD